MLEKFEFIKFLELKDYIFLVFSFLLIVALIIFLVIFFKPKKKVIRKFDDKKNNMEELLEVMQKDLEKKQEVPVPTFEEEQEAKAIISYQQLLETKNKNIDNSNVSKKEEPIVIPDVTTTIPLEQISESIKDEEKDLSNILEASIKKVNDANNRVDSKFTNSEVISPIFGRMTYDEQKPKTIDGNISNSVITNSQNIYPRREDRKINLETEILSFDTMKQEIPSKEELEILSIDSKIPDTKDHELEKTLNIRPLSNEVKKDEDFLKALKDLRNNL